MKLYGIFGNILWNYKNYEILDFFGYFLLFIDDNFVVKKIYETYDTYDSCIQYLFIEFYNCLWFIPGRWNVAFYCAEITKIKHQREGKEEEE